MAFDISLVPENQKISLTVDSADVNSSQTKLPVLVSLSSASGKTSFACVNVFTKLGSNSKKIAIEIGDTGVQVPIEIERWGIDNAQLWIPPDLLDSTDTVLNLYYDESQEDNTDYVGDTSSTDLGNLYPAAMPATSTSVDGLARNWRQSVPAGSQGGGTGRFVRIKFAYFDQDYSLNSVWIGVGSTVDDVYDFVDGTQVQVTVNGLGAITITEGLYSDVIELPEHFDGTQPMVLHFHNAGGTALAKMGAVSGSAMHQKAAADDGGTADVSGYSSNTSRYVFENIEFLTQAQAVWGGGYRAVYHMSQEPTGGAGCILDSTKNGNHGTPTGTWDGSELVDAAIGKALQFDGSAQYIDFGTDPSLDVPAVTLESNYQKHDNLWNTLISHSSATTANFDLSHGVSVLYFQWYNGGLTNVSSVNQIALDTWYNTAATHDGAGQVYLIEDGVASDKGAANSNLLTDDLNSAVAGNYPLDSEKANITQREVRISNVARSNDWLAITELSNTDNLLTFASAISAAPIAIEGSFGLSGTVDAEAGLISVIDGALGLSGTVDAQTDRLLAVDGSLGLGGDIELLVELPSLVALEGSFGLSGDTEMYSDQPVTIEGSLGLSGGMIVGEKQYSEIVGAFGLSGEVTNDDFNEFFSIQGGLGLGGEVAVTRLNNKIEGSFGLSGSIAVDNNVPVSMAGAFALSGTVATVRINKDLSMGGTIGLQGYVQLITEKDACTIPAHNSSRWT